MRLKRLEISGFKSFAKATTLEFSSPISGVVGPNGSGKSNIAEAIRWVLGEQSIKSLRGKRGEDLIFAGSPSASRLSRAEVNLIFDNSKKEFPLEFSEVSIGRRVFRDGVNDYILNGSEVRLKDVLELLARVGFGSSQHHIIGQGEADRILYASPRERKEMIEDALGLKIFQIKRNEAERKLEKTKENLKQVEGLQKEIQPHLKFLKTQAEKFEVSSKLREELKLALAEYLSGKLAVVERDAKKIKEQRSGPLRELKEIESEINSLRLKIEKVDRKENELGPEKALEEKLKEVRKNEMEALRELGRLEGMIALEEKSIKGENEDLVSKKEVERVLSGISERLDKVSSQTILEKISEAVGEIKKFIADFVENLPGNKTSAENLAKHKKDYASLQGRLSELKAESVKLSGEYDEKLKAARLEAEETRKEEKKVYQLELEAGKLKDNLRSLDFEEEKTKLLREEYGRELEDARIYLGEEKIKGGREFSSAAEMETFRKKVERLKIKLEEAGGIDSTVLKEYEEVSKRDEFLSKEIEDLEAAVGSLLGVMKDLDEKLEHDFKSGISKINHEFQKFFETMFGGGKAELKLTRRVLRKQNNEEEAHEKEDEGEDGIDITVNLPRKKIHSLDVLSGGERALTSIALLFAMSAVNPPPFLVLDETDAALDEANSQRYAKMLEDLSKTTQLVVITHNRTTMKCAGILYGVTMSKDGISKLLSLKFEEAGALVA